MAESLEDMLDDAVEAPPRLIVGMTGATGAAIGIRLLMALRDAAVETHLVVSKWGRQTIEHETNWSYEEVCGLADRVYAPGDMAAAVSSGSFVTDGMVVAPCSVRTLGAIAHGFGDTLVQRAADVVLKEQRRLVLVVRETPFSTIHLENMLRVARAGAVVMPPMPAFYNHPETIEDLIDHIVARVLDQFGIEAPFAVRWTGEADDPA